MLFRSPGIVHGTAIEHITSTVAGRVVWNAFFIGETHDFHCELPFLQIILELLQLGQFSQHGAQIGVFGIFVAEQLPQDVIRTSSHKSLIMICKIKQKL